MDNRIANDMISSGMIPSGKKNKEDLSRTQYGSAPSPNKLMDAYKSMYDKKEEVINEMAGKGMGMTPAPKPQGKLPKPQDPATSKPQKDFIKARISDSPSPKTEVEKDSSSPAPKTDSRMDQVKKQGFAKSYRKVGPKSETEDMLDKVKDRQVEKAVNRDKDVRRARASYIMTKYGESVDLLAAYRSVYEHHKKDADGNTIPHEGEEIKEEVDIFDTITNHFINEGYEERDIHKVMSSLTEEELKSLHEEPITATLLAIGGKLAAGAAAAGKAGLAAGAKGLAVAGKGLAAGGKAAMKGVVSAAKPVTQSISKGVTKVTTGAKDLASKGMTQVKKVVSPQPANKQLSLDLGKAGKSSPTGGSSDDALNRIKKFGRDQLKNKVGQEVSKDRELESTNKTKVTSAPKATLGASADLFDIVKGQLLDEGLSEEEILDIMLSLTPDEIMSEMAVNPNIAAMDAKNKADMVARAKAKEVPQDVKDASKRQYTAGGPKDKGENKYTTQDKKTIIDYNKNK